MEYPVKKLTMLTDDQKEMVQNAFAYFNKYREANGRLPTMPAPTGTAYEAWMLIHNVLEIHGVISTFGCFREVFDCVKKWEGFIEGLQGILRVLEGRQ